MEIHTRIQHLLQNFCEYELLQILWNKIPSKRAVENFGNWKKQIIEKCFAEKQELLKKKLNYVYLNFKLLYCIVPKHHAQNKYSQKFITNYILVLVMGRVSQKSPKDKWC